jgi:hypothetical protein
MCGMNEAGAKEEHFVTPVFFIFIAEVWYDFIYKACFI